MVQGDLDGGNKHWASIGIIVQRDSAGQKSRENDLNPGADDQSGEQERNDF